MKSEPMSYELEGYHLAGALARLERTLLRWQAEACVNVPDETVAITWDDAGDLRDFAERALMKWVGQDEERRRPFACEIAGWGGVADFERELDALIAKTRRSLPGQGPKLVQAGGPTTDPPPPNRTGPGSAA